VTISALPRRLLRAASVIAAAWVVFWIGHFFGFRLGQSGELSAVRTSIRELEHLLQTECLQPEQGQSCERVRRLRSRLESEAEILEFASTGAAYGALTAPIVQPYLVATLRQLRRGASSSAIRPDERPALHESTMQPGESSNQ
jgi:hypothetical protein